MKTMKKGLSILMSVLMVLSMFSGLLVTSYAAAPVIVMTMDTDEPAVGDTITITASCENMVGTQTGTIEFEFDPAYLRFISGKSTDQDFVGSIGLIIDTDNIVRFDFMYLEPAECDTDLCAITFKVLKPGETSITARVRIDSWAGVEAPADSTLSLTAQPEAERDVLTYGIYEGEAIVEDCDESAAGELVIPDTYQGYPVTGIASDAFYNCGALTSVTIPDSVTEIKGNAFAYCSGLTDITLPENLIEIGYDAFYKCSSLKTVTVPDGVTHIDAGAFYECTSLETVELPDSVTTIGSNAFAFCSSLKNVTIPDSVTNIGWQAFYKCVSLPKIAVPDGVTAISGSLFYGCSNLTTISLPDSIESIGAFAFLNTAYYKDASHWENDALYISDYLVEAKTTIRGDYTIKDGTGIIADNAFRNCADLTGISIPDSVKSIGSAAFASCSSLPAVEIPNSVTGDRR